MYETCYTGNPFSKLYWYFEKVLKPRIPDNGRTSWFRIVRLRETTNWGTARLRPWPHPLSSAHGRMS